MCEESASIELRSVDIALCVDEVTQVIHSINLVSLILLILEF